ncbi:MAG: hypothetical protein ACE5R4_18910 [Armatimonadota bacterium]
MRKVTATLGLILFAAAAGGAPAAGQMRRVPGTVREELRLDRAPPEVIRPRRTWTMAFVLLTDPDTDTTTPAFAAKLAKVEYMRQRVGRYFRVATGSLGALRPSAQVYVLQPDGYIPDVRVGPTNLLYAFVQSVTRLLYERTADEWDFIAIYEDYPDKQVTARHLYVQNEAASSGLDLFDMSADYGSQGRLLGVGLVWDVNDMPAAYDFSHSRMHLLLHETIGHQYGVHLEALAKPGAHFDLGIEAPSFTVMYGRPWVRLDDTHFTTAEVMDPDRGHFLITFHPWIMYIMGLKGRSEVPARIMKVHPDTLPAHRYDLVTTTGTFEWISFHQLFPYERVVPDVRLRAVPWNRLRDLIRARRAPPYERLPR